MIKLSTKARYGARAMTYIAAYGKGRPVSINEVADKEKISLKYLERIMSLLRSSGLLDSVKGAHGGYTFSGDMEAVTLLDIINSLEGPVKLVDLSKNSDEYERESYSGLMEIWKDLDKDISKKLSSITLKNMVENKKKKQEEKNPIYYI